jgi:hypothetical protein
MWFNTPQLAAAENRLDGEVLTVTRSLPIFEAKILFPAAVILVVLISPAASPAPLGFQSPCPLSGGSYRRRGYQIGAALTDTRTGTVLLPYGLEGREGISL